MIKGEALLVVALTERTPHIPPYDAREGLRPVQIMFRYVDGLPATTRFRQLACSSSEEDRTKLLAMGTHPHIEEGDQLTVPGVMNMHASAFSADTLNMSRDSDTHPPTTGPITARSSEKFIFHIK